MFFPRLPNADLEFDLEHDLQGYLKVKLLLKENYPNFDLEIKSEYFWCYPTNKTQTLKSQIFKPFRPLNP